MSWLAYIIWVFLPGAWLGWWLRGRVFREDLSVILRSARWEALDEVVKSCVSHHSSTAGIVNDSACDEMSRRWREWEKNQPRSTWGGNFVG